MEELKTITLKTNMTCDSCVSKVKPALEAKGITDALRFDMASPDKTVQFMGTDVQEKQAVRILENLGYRASLIQLSTNNQKISSVAHIHHEEKIDFWLTYKPLVIIASFLVLMTAVVEVRSGSFNLMRSMNNLMGGFFVFFSFFKFLDISKFADAYGTYDIIGKKSRLYSLAYPFIELSLGIGFLLGVFPVIVNILTVVFMIIGNIGVWQALKKNQRIQCACLGTIFNLPMTKVTLFENTLMLLMSAVSLVML